MNVGAALRGVSSLYIETAPLIYYVEENPIYTDRMKAVIDRIDFADINAISSVITLTEVLNQPIRLGKSDIERGYRDVLISSGSIQLLPVSVQIADIAAQLRARYNLRTPDAIHIATALESGCQAFLTNDIILKRVTELRIILLDELDTSPG